VKQRARGDDHRQAVRLVDTVHPHGAEMAKDLARLLDRKDQAQYGLHMVGDGDAKKMVGWARRLVAHARAIVEAA
jgi:hypothetical protein